MSTLVLIVFNNRSASNVRVLHSPLFVYLCMCMSYRLPLSTTPLYLVPSHLLAPHSPTVVAPGSSMRPDTSLDSVPRPAPPRVRTYSRLGSPTAPSHVRTYLSTRLHPRFLHASGHVSRLGSRKSVFLVHGRWWGVTPLEPYNLLIVPSVTPPDHSSLSSPPTSPTRIPPSSAL